MRRWNGWGDESSSMDLPESANRFLAQVMGRGEPLKDVELEAVLEIVPASRLEDLDVPDDIRLNTEKEVRIRHSKGQSLPDWLAMRSGDIGVFPDGVCYPENRQQVASILAFAKQYKIELIPYGGGTSVAGHINPNVSKRPVVTVNMGHMNQLLDLDPESNIATFGAGTPGPMVEAQLRAKGYTLGHFPQSFELSTIGGWVASRSSGQQSLRYGRIEQLFAGGILETFAGALELPTFPASSAGPDLRELILGSEGRFGILSEVKVRVSKLAEKEDFYVLFFPDWESATGFCREIAQQKIPLSMLRLSNEIETQTQLKLAGSEKSISWLEKYLMLRGCDDKKCMLTLGITGTNIQARSAKRQLDQVKRRFKGISTGKTLGKKWAKNRFKLPYLREALWQKGFAVDTLETATDWKNVNNMMEKVETVLLQGLKEDSEKVHVFTHISHVYGQGCSLYTTYLFRCGDDYQKTLARWQKLKHEASLAIVTNRGTISHQHGVGKDHAPYLKIEKGELGINVLQNICKHFDPNALLNPGTLLKDSLSE